MSTEDELRTGLRHQFGDPTASSTGPAGAGTGEWAAIEQRGQRRHDRRVAAAWVSGAAALLAVLVVVVTVPGHHSGSTTLASRGTGPSSTSAATTAQPGSTVTLVPTTVEGGPSTTGGGVVTTRPTGPVTTLGGSTPTTSTTPTTTGGLVDCGTAYLASGWPTTIAPSPTLAQCILDAFAAGTPAIYKERAQTDGNGGHIKITTYQVTGVHQVRRTVDATGAQPPGGITVSVCTGLAAGPDSQLVASSCIAG